MNTNVQRAVSNSSRPLGRGLLFVALLLASTTGSCVEIDGGAVELSWELRQFDGTNTETCSFVQIESVRLCWVPVTDAPVQAQCLPTRSETFGCPRFRGSTSFEIAAGPTALFIEVLCQGGDPAPPTDYIVPPPIVRQVEDGQIVTLNSLLIVAGNGGTSGADTCP